MYIYIYISWPCRPEYSAPSDGFGSLAEARVFTHPMII